MTQQSLDIKRVLKFTFYNSWTGETAFGLFLHQYFSASLQCFPDGGKSLIDFLADAFGPGCTWLIYLAFSGPHRAELFINQAL